MRPAAGWLLCSGSGSSCNGRIQTHRKALHRLQNRQRRRGPAWESAQHLVGPQGAGVQRLTRPGQLGASICALLQHAGRQVLQRAGGTACAGKEWRGGERAKDTRILPANSRSGIAHPPLTRPPTHSPACTHQ